MHEKGVENTHISWLPILPHHALCRHSRQPLHDGRGFINSDKGGGSTDGEVPELDGLVIGARDDEAVAELQAGDPVRVVAQGDQALA